MNRPFGLSRVLLSIAAVASTCQLPAEVILTRAGKLYEGDVSVSEAAVVVAAHDGPRVIPRADVVYRGVDRISAYRELAQNATTLKKRMELADWCLTYGLQAQAMEQCDQALKLSPGNAEVVALIQRASRVGEESATEANEPKPPPERPHGLPAATMSMYSHRVLPLLRNSCASAGCHNHASKSAFAIRRSVYRSDRAATLDSIIAQIDPLAPSSSPLIQHAVTAHGRRKRAPLSGPYAPRQIELLTEWVALVAAQQGQFKSDRPRVAVTLSSGGEKDTASR